MQLQPHQPSLDAQTKPSAINSGWPNFGRDETDHGCAIYAIAAYLEALGLKHLTSNFLLWLANYEGLEQQLEAELDPVKNVRDVLLSYVIAGRRCVPGNPDAEKTLVQEIARDISRRDFMYYKAFWGDDPMMPTGGKKLWNPAHQSWLSFVSHYREGQELWLWMSDEPALPEHLLPTILLRGA